MNISMRLWSQDHWDVFWKIGTSCVESTGSFGKNNIRCDKIRHPEQYAQKPEYLREIEKDRYKKCPPTRLKRGILLYNHDNYDCINDIIEEKLIHVNHNRYKLTRRGLNIYTQLKKHKTNVYMFTKDFSPDMDLVDNYIKTDTIRHGEVLGICSMCNGNWGFNVVTYKNSNNIYGEL